MRKQKVTTMLLGPLYKRSSGFIEIHLTYRCNLKCFNCDVSCRQAPSDEDMRLGQVQKFIQESIDNNVCWERIRLMGGEPTLHPQLYEVLNVLLDYKKKYSHTTEVVILTNGFGKTVQDILKNLPEGVEVNNTAKQYPHQDFRRFNMAPVDSVLYQWADYTNGCSVISDCGIGLTPFGYYPCNIAGGIDRVFGFDKGRKKLPLRQDMMVDQLKTFCRLCGHFRPPKLTNKEKMSSIWKKAYKKYKFVQPILTPY
ncbi:MAG: radical SAM protein [Candidatus Omnitrophota bacterium]